MKDVSDVAIKRRPVENIIEDAVSRSNVKEDQFHGTIEPAQRQGVLEHSAVGQSQSNSRAERAVNELEDIVRNYTSALKA